MRKSSVRMTATAVVACVLAWMLGAAAAAGAGTYTVNACTAERFGFGTHAFTDFSALGRIRTRGMYMRRACAPTDTAPFGLTAGNVLRSGRVKRGHQAGFVLDAAPGTSFVELKWSGRARRRDCRYAIQMYALGPDGSVVKKIRNWRANRNCRKADNGMQVSQVGGIRKPVPFPIAGATRIVQRTVCVGAERKRFCSARSINRIQTFWAQATVADGSPPAVGIVQSNAFTAGAWVNGIHSVNYNVSDNVGVKGAQALVGNSPRHDRQCDYSRIVPCNNDPGRIEVDTTRLREGTQPLAVRATDAADNVGDSPAVTVRVDRTAPAAPAVSVDGGEGWSAQNAFAVAWANPDEGDRAPITAAHWRLCRPGGRPCVGGSQSGTGISRLTDLRVPEPGEWDLRVVREDAAGNRNDDYSSQPVRLRHDPEAPALSFETAMSADPTRVSVAVTEKISGIAGGRVELSAEGSNTWHVLPTELDGNRLVARIDDAALPPGRYLLRAQASDLAGNVGVAAAPQALTLPLRIQSELQAGVRTVRKKGERKEGRRGARRRTVRELRRESRVRWNRRVTIAGRLTNRDGQPLPGLRIHVLAPAGEGEALLAVLTSDAKGRFTYRAGGSAGSRTLRFAHPGTPTVLPAESTVRLVVPAAGSFSVSRRRVLNGGRVVFRGRVRSLPLPAAGKLIELQVRQPTGEWTTFRTLRADRDGRWALRYRFRFVRCHTAYQLRARIPAETGYPFATGKSRSRRVTVRGAQGPCP